MVEQVAEGRFQVRCVCSRGSPIVEGSFEVVEASLRALGWEKTASDSWRCPVCWARAHTGPRPPLTGGASRKTVLLVEDDPDARIIYTSTLRYVGYRVIEAPTVKDARDAVGIFIPDAVVLDCRLPDGDGLQLVNAWRDSAMGRVPVIVVTAHGDRQDLEAAHLAGADMFVPKPCPGNVLAAHIDRVLLSRAPTRRLRTAT